MMSLYDRDSMVRHMNFALFVYIIKKKKHKFLIVVEVVPSLLCDNFMFRLT